MQVGFDGNPRAIFDAIDAHGGAGSSRDVLSFEELKSWIEEDPAEAAAAKMAAAAAEAERQVAAMRLGEHNDNDLDGLLEEGELRDALRQLIEGTGLPLADVFAKWDRDGSGSLRKKELLRAIKVCTCHGGGARAVAGKGARTTRGQDADGVHAIVGCARDLSVGRASGGWHTLCVRRRAHAAPAPSPLAADDQRRGALGRRGAAGCPGRVGAARPR